MVEHCASFVQIGARWPRLGARRWPRRRDVSASRSGTPKWLVSPRPLMPSEEATAAGKLRFPAGPCQFHCVSKSTNFMGAEGRAPATLNARRSPAEGPSTTVRQHPPSFYQFVAQSIFTWLCVGPRALEGRALLQGEWARRPSLAARCRAVSGRLWKDLREYENSTRGASCSDAACPALPGTNRPRQAAASARAWRGQGRRGPAGAGVSAPQTRPRQPLPWLERSFG